MSNTVVRTNVLSLNAHRNLGMVGLQQSKASARLSSGFRINSAADDAAGLGISEKMRSQIRGLDQASRNAQDGISLIQTAEGAMSTINDMVTRIRELVVQASNDTNAHEDDNLAQSDRVRIQDEINQLMDEIDATRNRTQFNTRNLIDGSLGSGQATNSGRAPGSGSITMRDIFGDYDDFASVLQGWFDKDAGGNIIGGYNSGGDATQGITNGDLGNMLTQNDSGINFSVIGSGGLDAAARLIGQALQEAIANAIGFTGFSHMNNASSQAEINANAVAWNNAVADWLGSMNAIQGTDTVAGGMNTENLSDLFERYANEEGTREQNIAAETLMNAMQNMRMNDFITGPPKFNHLDNSDDTNNSFNTNGLNWENFNVRPGNQSAAQNAVNAFIVKFAAETLGIVSGQNSAATLQNLLTYFNDGAHATVNNLDDLLTTLMSTASSGGQSYFVSGNGASDDDWVRYNAAMQLMQGIDNIIGQFSGNVSSSGGAGNALWFQIGANRDQGVHLSIEDVGTAALSNIGLNGQKAGEIEDGFSFADLRTSSSIAGIQTGDGVVQLKGEDIQKFITAIDEALAHVTGQRSLLGAMQNRLEYTIENLDIASENLSAAESRIRDADMAKEMMNLTQSNVLQQAAISMLAQANQAPQSVLQLLG